MCSYGHGKLIRLHFCGWLSGTCSNTVSHTTQTRQIEATLAFPIRHIHKGRIQTEKQEQPTLSGSLIWRDCQRLLHPPFLFQGKARLRCRTID